MRKCPLTREECTVDCAWFREGECCVISLPDLGERLEDVVTSIEMLEHTIGHIDFTM